MCPVYRVLVLMLGAELGASCSGLELPGAQMFYAKDGACGSPETTVSLILHACLPQPRSFMTLLSVSPFKLLKR